VIPISNAYYAPVGKTSDFTLRDTVFHWDADTRKLSFSYSEVEVVLTTAYQAPKGGWWDTSKTGFYVSVWLDGTEYGNFWYDTDEIKNKRLRKAVEFGLTAWVEQRIKSKADSLAKLPE
jgi:hypothetical protein